MKRIFRETEGYDCINNPCHKNGCGTKIGAGHGRACGRWLYAVAETDIALVLTVRSGIFPPSARLHVEPHEPPEGTDLSTHAAWPVERENVQNGTRGEECCFLADGRCFIVQTTALGAMEFFKEHGRLQREQSDGFWLALEDRFVLEAKEARLARADTKWARCLHCDGLGTVSLGTVHKR
jgi:hypothetical protein